MEMFPAFFPLAIVLAFICLIALIAGHPEWNPVLWWAVLFAFSCLIASPHVAAAILLATILIVSTRCQLVSYRTFASLLVVTVTGTCLAAIATHYHRIKYLNGLRSEYPLASIVHRLEYESAATEAIGRSARASDSMRIRDGLETLEREQQVVRTPDVYGHLRQRSLAALHQRRFDRFVTAPGFGISRGIPSAPEWVELPPLEPIPMQCAPSADKDERLAFSPVSKNLQQTHWESAGDFVQSARIGYVQDRDHVAGFQPHALSGPPQLVLSQESLWRVNTVELVSLLKHNEPCVYETEVLPNMDLLSRADIPTRPLDEFESRSLQHLWAEEDIVIDESAAQNEIRMLRSLRAARECCECHAVPRGTLLGAFSYRLQSRANVDSRSSRRRQAADVP